MGEEIKKNCVFADREDLEWFASLFSKKAARR